MSMHGDEGRGVWPYDGLLVWAEREHLAATGRSLGTYEVVRAMPWSTVVRWTVDGRHVWGKAACPGFAAECSLLPALAEVAPEHVLSPIATDPEHGWMLLPDGGTTIATTVTVTKWEQVLINYADLQRLAEGHVDRWLRVGCIDMRPDAAVVRLEEMMREGHVPADANLVHATRMTASTIDLDVVPATIQHDDLGPDNVFASGSVFDWGDAVVAHPFSSLLTALMDRPNRPGTPKEKAAMRDSYLRRWQRTTPDGQLEPSIEWLRHQADLAVMLAPISRIDRWLCAPTGSLDAFPGAIERWVDVLQSTDWPG